MAGISARITAASDNAAQLNLAAAALEQRLKNRLAAEEVEFSELLAAREAQGVRIRDEDRTFTPSYDWREDWLRGRIALAVGESVQARAAFERVDDAIPGELAPKLALAMASEQAGDLDAAAEWYGHVSRTDPASTTANFGRVRCLIRAPGRSLDGLQQAAEVLRMLQLGGDRLSTHQLGAELLLAAVPLANNSSAGASASLLGVRMRERDLRFGAEREFLRCCSFATTRRELAEYIRLASRARPVTLF